MKVYFFAPLDVKCGVGDYARFLKEAVEKTGASADILPLNAHKRLRDFIKLGKSANEADIAHIHYVNSFFAPDFFQSAINCWIFLKQIRIPKIITLHEITIPRKNRPFFRLQQFILFFVQGIVFSSADLLIIHTKENVKYLPKMGIVHKKIFIMIHPIPEKKEIKNDAGLDKKSLFKSDPGNILTIFGFIGPRKGCELILAIAKDLDDCLFLFAGGPHPNDKSRYCEDLKNKIKESGLAERVKITGYIPESNLSRIMMITDIMLAPFYETFGSSSVTFAIAYGKPIIASDIGYFKELKENGAGIELFRNGDCGDLKEKISGLISDAKKQAGLKKLNSDYASKHSYSQSALRMRQVYQILIDKSRKI